MVHALRETHRVLKPGGILIDLRPAPVHRRIGIEIEGQFELLAVMTEKLDDDHTANRAVAEVVEDGLFEPVSRARFDCKRVMGSLKDFRAWLDEFVTGVRMPSQDRLFQKIVRAYEFADGRKKVVIRGPLVLRGLRKVEID